MNAGYGVDMVTGVEGDVARTLRQTSRLLGRLARRLALQHPTAAMRAPELEFYAESGAPEGALDLDGELVGYLPGVKRL